MLSELNNLLVDTNILFEYFVESPNTSQIQELFANNKNYIFEGCLFELQSILKNFISSKYAHQCVEELLESKDYNIIKNSSKDIEKALDYTLWHESQFPKKNLSLIDAVQIHLASINNIKLVTLDGQMYKYPNCISL